MVRFLSPSRLKKLLAPFSLTTYTYTTPVSSFLRSLVAIPSYSSQTPTKTLPFVFLATPFSSQPIKNQSLSNFPLTRDGNYVENDERGFPICPGCGIHMQEFDYKQPGFFVNPANKGLFSKKLNRATPIVDESEVLVENEIASGERLENLENADQVFDKMPKNVENLGIPDKKLIVCSRCHNLKYHGKVARLSAEKLLPDFDFDHTVGKRLMMSINGERTVVLVVVDATDFDGSFPRKVVDLVSKIDNENVQSMKEGKMENIPNLMLVVTKIDLLPSNILPTRLGDWFRARSMELGGGKLTSVHLVSPVRDWGIKILVDDVVKLAGQRGNVWVVGAQNSGKSALVNAIGKCGGVKTSHLTVVPLPGTTLGIVRLEGLLLGEAKLFDTPGILHPHQLSTRLMSNEHKLIRIDKELKPRTYRIKAGHSIHIGGLLRLDVEESSVDYIYVTVWASLLLTLHMGKTEDACKMLDKHFGYRLKPPIQKYRVPELGKWVKREFRVVGNWWDSSAVDIAAAGVGWFAVGLKGEALVGVWTYDGVDVILRDALLPQRSHILELPGFAVSEFASKANQTRSEKHKNKKKSKRNINSTRASSSAPSTLIIDADSHSTNSVTSSDVACSQPSPSPPNVNVASSST